MPPGTRARAIGNLPIEPTSFVGRRPELTEAKRLLSGARLVTLTGIGGVGKTRLALRVAEDSRRAFEDGVWLVEFGELQDEALVPDTVATALGLREHPAHPPLVLLTEYLTTRTLLLVLDNCEHLIDAVAKLADSLLRSCPDLRILATSREPLVIGGEAVLRVPALAVPDRGPTPELQNVPQYEAVALFAERAAAALPGFALTEDNLAQIVQICRRLDGLPLPIELAARRMRSIPAEEILEGLNDLYMTVSRQGSLTRQQSLRMSIDWSHELCTRAEQVLWRRLAVFAGSFGLDSAEGVCTGGLVDPPDLLDVVASLVDKSILIREEAGSEVRYRMLETLRAYGREKLREAGEFEALLRRNRDWYEGLMLGARSEWIGPRQPELMVRIAREQPNLREAMEFSAKEPGEADHAMRIAIAMFPFWLSRGLLSEGRHWLDRALDLPGEVPTAHRIKALCANCLLTGNQGDITTATAQAEEALRLAEDLGDPAVRGVVMHAAGYLAAFAGDVPRAVACLEEALEVFRTQGNPIRQISTLLGLAVAYGLLDDPARAIEYQEHALAISGASGEFVYRAYAVCALGLALWKTDPRRADELLERGLQLARQTDDMLATAMCVEAKAWIAIATDRARRAALLLGAARTMWQRVGSPGAVVPKLESYHEECERRTRRALGESAFESAFRDGARWTAQETIAFALGEDLGEENPEPTGAATTLTPRELQVADLVAQGLTNKAIAAKLVIAQRTAQGHVEHVLAKLGFNSRAQIAAWVVERQSR
ncbi:ATP-binding protein [Rhodococcus maanshanensis]|uniref:Non-specific serine/threonine protein kinase n=1 Tax=Rhodococcus maanshanensis TaxID=183556 RepID=A0A1H7HAR4_9NOCA|nr:LuxR C-terminal-related transcriptional regulator [Rhodococcus maanshanensis]SEK47339.1 non-specific serine/threonine protein kinase [Rhodococcus maanshanensis]